MSINTRSYPGGHTPPTVMGSLMTRALLFPLTITLALATGLTLLGIATTLTHNPITVVSSTVSTEAVRRFYAAANEVLQTGNATSLAAAVAPDYREYTVTTASPAGIARYIQFLTELRSVCPECRLKVEELSMGNNEAAVGVSTHGLRQGKVQGVSVEGLALDWSALDVLRFAGGLVAQRWSQSDALSLAEPLSTEVTVDVPTGSAIVQVSRFILPAGARLPPVAGPGQMLLVVEAGTLVVHTAHAIGISSGSDAVPVDVVLGRGERLVLTPDRHQTVRNDGPTRAVVLVLVLRAGPESAADVGALS